MKKILLILTLCFFALGIVACNNGNDNGDDKENAYFISQDLKLQVGDSYKVEYQGEEVQLVVANEELAKLSTTDFVTALKIGQTKIQLKSGEEVLDEINLEVVESSYKDDDSQTVVSTYRISLDYTDKRIFPSGNFTLTAKVYKNNSVCDEQVTWNFGGEENAIISAVENKNQIVISGKSQGITHVTATIGEFSAVCKVTVSDILSKDLSAPEFTSLTATEISWQEVSDAEGYSVSVNNGMTWKDVESTTFNYGQANPLNVRVVALGDGIMTVDSEESKLTQKNVKFSCGDRIVFYTDKTVSGVENTEKLEPVTVEVSLVVKDGEPVKLENQEFSIPNASVVSMSGNTFTPVKEGEVDISLVGVNDIVLKAVVGTPIKTRVDLDTLGFAYKNSTHKELWSLGRVYLLANDIDYMADVSEQDKGLRMTDNNSEADLWDRYLIPIAANRSGSKANNAFNGQQICQTEWGIFGKLSGETSGDHTFFFATMDGDGHAIKNAVIPYGVSFSYEPTQSGINSNHGSNFIGALVYGAQLRNIAFTNLEFEDPVQVGKALGSNPYYTDANENLKDTILKSKGYITNTTIKNGNFSHQYFNPSNRTGLVGLMQNAIISNVYVQAKMKNGTFSTRSVNGLVVAFIDKDSYVNGSLNGGIGGKVENCIVETAYSTADWLGYLIDYTGTQTQWTNLHEYNSGMGAIVGTSFLEDASAIKNCFAVGNLQTFTKNDASDKTTVTTIFSPGTELRHSASKGEDLSINCRVYVSIADLRLAQSLALEDIGISSYLSE